MKKKLTFILLLVVLQNLGAQIYESEMKPEGIIFPRINTAQRNTLNPVIGQCIYNIDLDNIQCYDGSVWKESSENKVAFIGATGPGYSLQDGATVTISNLRIYDGNNNYDGSSFTAPSSGFYHFDASLLLKKETEDINEVIGYIHIGSVFRQVTPFRIKIDEHGEAVNLSKTVYMNAGEQVKLFIQVFTEGPTVSLVSGGFNDTGGWWSYFSGFKVGGETDALLSFAPNSPNTNSFKKITNSTSIPKSSYISSSQENNDLYQRLNLLETELVEMKELVKELTGNSQISSKIILINQRAKLEQNVPNPFNGATKIQYFVPPNSQVAKVKIYGIRGELVKNIDIESFGKGEIELQVDKLSNGIYHYSLEVDGKVIDTKKMSSIK